MAEEQLWHMALTLQPTLPLISRACCLQLIEHCALHDIKIANLFYHRVCTGCGRIFQPGLTCKVRWQNKREIRSERRRFISRLTGGLAFKKSKCIVYECVCQCFTIFDMKIDHEPDSVEVLKETPAEKTPIKTVNPEEIKLDEPSPPKPVVKAVKLDKKAAELQKVLARSSQAPKETGSGSLSSFLKSLKK